MFAHKMCMCTRVGWSVWKIKFWNNWNLSFFLVESIETLSDTGRSTPRLSPPKKEAAGAYRSTRFGFRLNRPASTVPKNASCENVVNNNHSEAKFNGKECVKRAIIFRFIAAPNFKWSICGLFCFAFNFLLYFGLLSNIFSFNLQQSHVQRVHAAHGVRLHHLWPAMNRIKDIQPFIFSCHHHQYHRHKGASIQK